MEGLIEAGSTGFSASRVVLKNEAARDVEIFGATSLHIERLPRSIENKFLFACL